MSVAVNARAAGTLLFLLSAAACIRQPPVSAGTPVADPAAVADEVRRASIPAGPKQTSFAWELTEQGSRLSGRGVVRYQAPERLRLDLFGPRGETYLAAGLVGEEFFVPEEVSGRVPLPSPTLLWGALGVIRPPAGEPLLGVTRGGEGVVLRYGREGSRTFEFQVDTVSGTPRLRRVDLRAPSGVLESVELTWADTGALQRARYRNWAAFRELILKMENTTDASPFPESIWTPDRAAR